VTYRLHPSILREYDIRGICGETLWPADAFVLGWAFARVVAEAGGRRVAVGRDGRLSSPVLEAALAAGLRAGGAAVLPVGQGPTPLLYFAERSTEQVEGGIQVTGSHNPPDHNGFKIVLQGAPFFGADLLRLGQIAEGFDPAVLPEGFGAVWHGLAGGAGVDPILGDADGAGEGGEIFRRYIDALTAALEEAPAGPLAALRVGWDAGNGAAGPAIEALCARLPGEHHLLYTRVDGHFPHHHPDPTVEENLADLRSLVLSERLDFGVAFDGDGDRLGVIDGHGRVVWGDQLLLLFAADLLESHPGARILADVKTSQGVFDGIAALGGQPLMCETGHSWVKSRMKQAGALLAGEMTGHLFFADRYFGFDDALYAAVRLMAAVARQERSVADMLEAMPVWVNTPELRFAVPAARKAAVVAEVAARLRAEGADVVTIDGLRVRRADGWWLLRASNTQEMLVARAESADAAGLARLLAELDGQLAASGVARAGGH